MEKRLQGKLLSSLISVIIIFFYVRIVYVKAMHIPIDAFEDKNGIYDIEMSICSDIIFKRWLRYSFIDLILILHCHACTYGFLWERELMKTRSPMLRWKFGVFDQAYNIL